MAGPSWAGVHIVFEGAIGGKARRSSPAASIETKWTAPADLIRVTSRGKLQRQKLRQGRQRATWPAENVHVDAIDSSKTIR